MKEVLDRIELPPWEDIPDEAMIASKPGGLNRWTIPHTEITLVRLKEGLHEGNWVFHSEADERAPEFYERVKQMPYKPGASEGLYQLFVSEPGWMIPRSLIGALPGWMQLRPGGQAVWQWCALVLTLLVTAVLMVLIFRLSGYWSRTRRGAGYYLTMVFPIFAIVLPQTATDFLSDQVFITGKLFAALDFALDLVSLGALVALILGITNRLATAMMVVPWFKPRPLNAQLAQLIIRAMGVAGALIAVFEGGRYLGVPLTTLVAGVSVSGLTVALAAQDTLRNLFGSLMIVLDRPEGWRGRIALDDKLAFAPRIISAKKLEQFRIHAHVALRIVRLRAIVLGGLDTDHVLVPAKRAPGQHIDFVAAQTSHRAQKEDLVFLGMFDRKLVSRALEQFHHVEGRAVARPVHALNLDAVEGQLFGNFHEVANPRHGVGAEE